MSESPRTPLASSDSTSEAGHATPADAWLEDDIDLGHYLRALQRRWPWLAAGAVIFALAAGGYAYSRPVFYESSTTLIITSPLKTPGAQTNPETFRAIIANASLADEVIRELHLDQAPHRLTPQGFLERALTVEAAPGADVVRVKVKLLEPNVAAAASSGLAQKATLLARQLGEREGSSVQEQLRGHLTAAAERMAAQEAELLQFRQRAQVEVLKEDTDAMLDERGDLLKLTIAIESEKARLATAREEIGRHERLLSVGRSVGAEEALRNASPATDDVTAAATASPRLRDRQEKVPLPPGERVRRQPATDTAARAEALDLTNPFINPVYQTLDFQIATSRARLAALEQQRRQLADVKNLGRDAAGPLSELYKREVELARLQSAFDLTKRIHSDLTVRYEESRTQALGNAPQLQLVDKAIPPDRPLPRGVLRFGALGFAVGLIAASVLALILESR